MSHTAHYGSGEAAWDRFLDDLRSLPSDLSVIGINDYLWVDGYERVRNAYDAGDLPNLQAIFPVVELRLNDFIGTDGKLARVNAHVIFSPDTDAELIRQQFIARLVSDFKLSGPYEHLGKKWNAIATRDAIANLGQLIKSTVPLDQLPKYQSDATEGFNNWVIPLARVEEALDNSCFTEAPLLALGKTEWEDIPWNDNTIAAKKNLINSADLIFTAASTPAAFERSLQRLRAANVNDRLLDCSDAHHFSDSGDKDRLGNCFTWICAEPTLAGLKHALYEYPARIFIGSKPTLLVRQQADPTHFVSNVEIRPVDTSRRPSPAFNISIPINAGFVAVIGNKGSGKSALLDSIALVASSKAQGQFSFLSDQRFRNPRNNKARHYQATLTMADGDVIGPHPLSADVDDDSPERIRYLPQSLLENLCNKEPGSPDDAFERELRSIIFSHVPPHQRLGCTSLDELLLQRSASLDREIDYERLRLAELNRSIADIEEKSRPSRLVALRSGLAAIERQITGHDALRPVEPTPPESTADADEDPIASELTSLRAERASLHDEQAQYEAEYAQERLRANAADNLHREIDILRSSFDEFVSRSRPLAEDAGLEVDELVSLTVNIDALDRTRAHSAARLAALDDELAADGDVARRRLAVDSAIESLERALDEPQRRYEQERADLEAWKDARARLVGNVTEDGTRDHFAAQLAEAQTLPEKLIEQRISRLRISQRIYTLLSRKVELHRELYRPVQSFLQSNELAREHFSLEFEAGLEVRDFTPNFLDYVDRGMSSSFYGVDASAQRIQSRVRVLLPDQWNSMSSFLEEIDRDLRFDRRGKADVQIDGAADVLRKGVSLGQVYDYVFGLEYVEAQFELRSEGRSISELSPGQKGTILLMFYLLVDRSGLPIALDQPDENLDNQTVHSLLRPAIRSAKMTRQILVVTHSPNLAVVGDADQVIVASCDGDEFAYKSGAIETPSIRDLVVDVLEGTWPAFDDRRRKYVASARNGGATE